MERIIINENAAKYEREIGKLMQYIGQVNEVLEQFEGQTGYSPNLQDVQEIITSKKTESLTKNLEASLDRQLDKLKIVSKVILDNMKSNTEPIIKELVNKINWIAYTNAGLYSHNLAMADGKLYLPEEQAEEIKDSIRYYVASDEAKEFYKLHKAAEKVLNDLFTFVSANTRLRPYNIGDYFALFPATGKVECEELDYEGCILKEETSAY